MDKVASLGCICCLLNGCKDTPAQIHHIRKNQGKSVRNHRLVLPLCPYHHTDGPEGEAVHAGEKVWKWEEFFLWHLVERLLERMPRVIGECRA